MLRRDKMLEFGASVKDFSRFSFSWTSWELCPQAGWAPQYNWGDPLRLSLWATTPFLRQFANVSLLSRNPFMIWRTSPAPNKTAGSKFCRWIQWNLGCNCHRIWPRPPRVMTGRYEKQGRYWATKLWHWTKFGSAWAKKGTSQKEMTNCLLGGSVVEEGVVGEIQTAAPRVVEPSTLF
jgi:hypothetical protein